jgi:hypothetical protein
MAMAVPVIRVRVVIACLAATVATAGPVTSGSEGMPNYRLAGNPWPWRGCRYANSGILYLVSYMVL